MRAIWDVLGCGLTLLCMLHCAMLPLLASLAPALSLGSVLFSGGVLLATALTWALAMTTGLRQHGRPLVPLVGGLGLAGLTGFTAIDTGLLAAGELSPAALVALRWVSPALLVASHVWNALSMGGCCAEPSLGQRLARWSCWLVAIALPALFAATFLTSEGARPELTPWAAEVLERAEAGEGYAVLLAELIAAQPPRDRVRLAAAQRALHRLVEIDGRLAIVEAQALEGQRLEAMAHAGVHAGRLPGAVAPLVCVYRAELGVRLATLRRDRAALCRAINQARKRPLSTPIARLQAPAPKGPSSLRAEIELIERSLLPALTQLQAARTAELRLGRGDFEELLHAHQRVAAARAERCHLGRLELDELAGVLVPLELESSRAAQAANCR